jgi:hypothetical protein
MRTKSVRAAAVIAVGRTDLKSTLLDLAFLTSSNIADNILLGKDRTFAEEFNPNEVIFNIFPANPVS